MNTYEEILERMRSKYTELSGIEVDNLSDIDIRLKVLAGEIYKEQVNLEFVKNQMFVQTATGEYLDYHAVERGLSRKPAVKATGNVRFNLTNPLEVDLVVPKGTVVSTSGTNPIRFYTNKNAVIVAGKSYGTIACTAEQPGVASNVIIGAVSVLITSVPGINSVSNKVAFTGGTDQEDDESLRQRIIDSYNEIANGTNEAYYKKLALSVPGVTSVGVVPKRRGVGTIDIYICSNKENANATLIANVQNVMNKAREINVDVKVASGNKVKASLDMYISILEGYDYSNVASKVKKAITNYISSLGIGESIYKNHIGKVVLSVEGVKNYNFGTFYDSEYIIDADSFLVLDDLILEELAV